MASKYTDHPLGFCAECPPPKKLKRLTNPGPNGRICSNCYKKKQPRKLVNCKTCKQPCIPFRRVLHGVLCQVCGRIPATPKEGICAHPSCGKFRPIHDRKHHFCWNCYKKFVWKPKPRKCSICGRSRPVAKYTEDGKPLCYGCRQRKPKEKCGWCGKKRNVGKRDPIDPSIAVCVPCTNEELREIEFEKAHPNYCLVIKE